MTEERLYAGYVFHRVLCYDSIGIRTPDVQNQTQGRVHPPWDPEGSYTERVDTGERFWMGGHLRFLCIKHDGRTEQQTYVKSVVQ